MNITSQVHITPSDITVNGKVVCDEQPLLKSAYKSLGMNYPKFYKMDTLCQAGVLGAEYVIEAMGLSSRYENDRIATIFNNRTSSLGSDLIHTGLVNDNKPSPAVFVYTLPNIVLGEIAIRHGWHGEQICTVSESQDAELLAQIMNSMVIANKADAILYISIEATLTGVVGRLVLLENESGDNASVNTEQLSQILNSHG